MAAMMGGTMRAPLTATLFAVELTGNFSVLLPVLTACAFAYGLTVLLLKRSILTEKIARRGHHITREYRSGEHTSELQSLMRISYAVFCLKKKKTQNITHTRHIRNHSYKPRTLRI